MDSCWKFIVFIAITYVLLFAKERHIRASAQNQHQQIPDQEPSSDILYLNPDFERSIANDADNEIHDEFIAEPKENQERPKPSFWRELEGQIFLAELFNLTKNKFNDFELAPNMSNKLDECQQLNSTIDKIQRQINELLEVTALERSYQMASNLHRKTDSQPKKSSFANNINNSPLPARQNQVLEVFFSLNEFTALFFGCLANIEQSEEKLKNSKYESLHNDLLPLTNYMRKIGSLIETHNKMKMRPNIDNGLSFAKILPEDQDFKIENLNQIRIDKDSLIGKLVSTLDDLKLNMKEFVDENKDFLDPFE